jgi:hypothetical protein
MNESKWISGLMQIVVLFSFLFVGVLSEAKVSTQKKGTAKMAGKKTTIRKNSEKQAKKSAKAEVKMLSGKTKKVEKKLAKLDQKKNKRAVASVNKKKKH